MWKKKKKRAYLRFIRKDWSTINLNLLGADVDSNHSVVLNHKTDEASSIRTRKTSRSKNATCQSISPLMISVPEPRLA
jgi:hypothetical protein